MFVRVLLLNVKEGAFQGTSCTVILYYTRSESRFDFDLLQAAYLNITATELLQAAYLNITATDLVTMLKCKPYIFLSLA